MKKFILPLILLLFVPVSGQNRNRTISTEGVLSFFNPSENKKSVKAEPACKRKRIGKLRIVHKKM